MKGIFSEHNIIEVLAMLILASATVICAIKGYYDTVGYIASGLIGFLSKTVKGDKNGKSYIKTIKGHGYKLKV